MTNQEGRPLKNISIMCCGSRGDFQPYLALDTALKSKGYNICLLSSIKNQSFAEDFCINFVAIDKIPLSQLVKENQGMRELIPTGSFLTFLKHIDLEQQRKDDTYVATAFWKKVYVYPPDLFIMGTQADNLGLYLQYVCKIPILSIALHVKSSRV